MYVFEIEYLLRKGVSAVWVDKHTSIGLDDLPDDTTPAEAKAMAIIEFKQRMNNVEEREYQHGDRHYIIKDVSQA